MRNHGHPDESNGFIFFGIFFGDDEHPAPYLHLTYDSGLVRFVLG